MVPVIGGQFLMGSDTDYREEAPQHRKAVADFMIATTEVTNSDFAAFVEATGYVTTAEQSPDPALLPKNSPSSFRQPGAAVFLSPDGSTAGNWRYIPGANWRHPDGPASDIDGRDSHPVVQVSLADAKAYASWKGARLPTEAEWEYAARAGRPATRYEWGDTPPTPDDPKANTWQGLFPVADTGADGFRSRAPVGCFEANPWGLHDMTGNVWEWTASTYQQVGRQTADQVMVVKGGSYLCAANFCRRYRPPARQGQEASLPTNHIGFRIAADTAATAQE
ncbi:formylglycine-generating enzyme family protein [Henriciella marina]|uniref:formylglycine-generating enzyme family protein n=1 Tax=Henriciella marina TaxID=453851 RepID=UPI000379628B|nr:formylglycine-generating enzyme family protein [Henriciella marina]